MNRSIPRAGLRLLGALLVLQLGAAVAAAAKSVTVELESGDKVSGELISESARETVIEHPIFGRLVIPREEIEPGDGEQPGLFGTSFMRGWHKEVGMGLQGQEGNSPEGSIRANLGLRRETESWRWKWEGIYRVVRENSNRTSNYGELGSRYDRLMPGSRWFAFVGGRYQYDEFETWVHRVQSIAGPGYHVVDSEKFSLDALFGPAYTYEFGSRDEGRVEVLLGLEASWGPFEGHKLRFSNHLLPQVNASEFRNLTRAEWKMKLMGSEHLALVLGLDNEYDTADEGEKYNLKYWSSLAYDF